MAYSAATAAAIAALFNPLPASAAPPAAPPAPAVPDAGSRPLAQGSLVLPGQQVASTPTTTAPITTPGVALSPVMAKIEKGRTELAALGEQLTKAKGEVDLVTQQITAADQKVTQSSTAISQARTEVASAAASAVRDAAALPPGSLRSGLSDLDSLARINRGDSATQQAAARQLTIAQSTYDAALAEQQAAQARLTTLTADRDKLQKSVDKKSAAQQKLEQDNAAAIAAADSAQAAQDARAGAGYLAGENAGRGADPRAIAALRFALAQRGDPYVWSEEGPDEYDCSGLMWAAYRSPGAGDFKLTRVSRDQYFQTRERVVDRYSLLPGDLLFFSSSSSWQQIHHVAMYAGNGMMVEAPRTGLNVRLVPVRWTRLFSATRIYGSIEGTVQGPNLGSPDPEKPSDHNTRPNTPSPRPTTPSPKPTTPSPKPTTPAPKPTTVSPKPTTPEATPTTTAPATTAPATTAPATTAPPAATAAPATKNPADDKPSTPQGSAGNSPTKDDKPSPTKDDKPSATSSQTKSSAASTPSEAGSKSAGS
ncbi:C40 family peptidase [Actinoplanes auranticolor]|uniref:NlpC/P60 domain-containing protein n=1 Tax=Actinoplanes auranticolor TaxID=47988 RepID=A0A919SBB4_9ACTN|nr:NlpC/P60 family protein [Actinoplanes auranticolor]GIM69459.1 hypothetical protein Aau02nite_36150 [Actinoplanes auranticolor]